MKRFNKQRKDEVQQYYKINIGSLFRAKLLLIIIFITGKHTRIYNKKITLNIRKYVGMNAVIKQFRDHI